MNRKKKKKTSPGYLYMFKNTYNIYIYIHTYTYKGIETNSISCNLPKHPLFSQQKQLCYTTLQIRSEDRQVGAGAMFQGHLCQDTAQPHQVPRWHQRQRNKRGKQERMGFNDESSKRQRLKMTVTKITPKKKQERDNKRRYY